MIFHHLQASSSCLVCTTPREAGLHDLSKRSFRSFRQLKIAHIPRLCLHSDGSAPWGIMVVIEGSGYMIDVILYKNKSFEAVFWDSLKGTTCEDPEAWLWTFWADKKYGYVPNNAFVPNAKQTSGALPSVTTFNVLFDLFVSRWAVSMSRHYDWTSPGSCKCFCCLLWNCICSNHASNRHEESRGEK